MIRTLRIGFVLAVALLPIAGRAVTTKSLHLPSPKRVIKKIKTGISELVRSEGDHVSDNEETLRNLERNLTHVLWPLTGRVLEVLPSGYGEFDFIVIGGLSAVSTLGGTVGDYLLREESPAYYWKRFGSGSPIGAFLRGAYGGVGISAIGLGVVLPIVSGGTQVDPQFAAEVIAGTSLFSGTIRAIGKVLGNREYQERNWERSAERALENK